MVTDYKDRTIGDPSLNPGDEPYFAAAAEGRLVLKHCKACDRTHHHPRSFCPFCWSGDVEWKASQGTGEIYTFSVTRRGAGAPYCIAYVRMDEGTTMMTNIVDTDLDAVHIGQRVRVTFKKSEDGTAIPMFTPIGG